MEMIFTPEIIGCIGNLVSAVVSEYDVVVQIRIGVSMYCGPISIDLLYAYMM